MRWTNSDDTPITTDSNGFTIDTGSASFNGDAQTTTLTVPASQTDQDKTYKCLVTSHEHGVTDKSTTVHLKVFGKSFRS